MNKIGRLCNELHDAEQALGHQFRVVADRQAAEQDVYNLCHKLAVQVDDHVVFVARVARRFGEQLSAERDGHQGLLGAMRHRTSEAIGRRPEAGLLLLHDLRELYVMAEDVNICWLALGQVAQAVRDLNLLDELSPLHKQTLTQIKWLKTRIKEAAPQILVTAA